MMTTCIDPQPFYFVEKCCSQARRPMAKGGRSRAAPQTGVMKTTGSNLQRQMQKIPVRPSYVRETRIVPRLLDCVYTDDKLLERNMSSTDRPGARLKLPRFMPKPALVRCMEKICSTSRIAKNGEEDEYLTFDASIEKKKGPQSAKWNPRNNTMVFNKAPREWIDKVNIEKDEKGKACVIVAAGSMYEFFKLHHKHDAPTIQRLFTKFYVEPTEVPRDKKDKQDWERWTERVRLACRREDMVLIADLMAKTYRASGEPPPLKEDEQDDPPLPFAFQSAMQTISRDRDRFPNGGRAILSSGCGVALRDDTGPCIGVPIGLAMRVSYEQCWSDDLISLVARGPCRYPGAHYIISSDGRRRYIQVKGFDDEEQARKWIGADDTRIVGRHLLDRDLVGLTRSPVVSPHNHMYFRVKIVAGSSLRPHDVVLKPYDADYDGDAMILYIPRDTVASMQWYSQRPGKLMCYHSGAPAMELMLDGKLGLSLNLQISRSVLLSLAALIPRLRLRDIDDLIKTKKEEFGLEEALFLCTRAALDRERFSPLFVPNTLKDVDKSVRLITHHRGSEAAMALLFNAQNIGAELAREANLPGFCVFDFISPPALHKAQSKLLEMLENWVTKVSSESPHRRRIDVVAWRRDLHEVVVSFTEPFSGRGPAGYTPKVLEAFAEAAQYLECGSRQGLQACRSTVKNAPIQVETYLIADLKHNIKTCDAAAALATGILRGTVSEHWRNCAAVSWPEEQPSFMLRDRMACNVSSVGATLQAIHGIEGLSGKAIIAKTGEMRNNAAQLLADVRRDAMGVLRGPLTGTQPGERCALMTAKSMPASLWVKPSAILDGIHGTASSSSADCPWKSVGKVRRFGFEAQRTIGKGIDKSKNAIDKWLGIKYIPGRLQQIVDFWGEETQKKESRLTNATYLGEESCLRKFSGHRLPVLHWTLVNGCDSDGPKLSERLDPPSLLCAVCSSGLIVDSKCSNGECKATVSCPIGAIIASADVSVDDWACWAPSAVENVESYCIFCEKITLRTREVRRPCSTGSGSGWSVQVCASCGKEASKEKRKPPTYYSIAAKLRHRRSAYKESLPFLRVELDKDNLLLAGYTEAEEFELVRFLDVMFPEVIHAVIGWDMLSVRTSECVSVTPPVVVLHVFNVEENTPLEFSAGVKQLLNHVAKLRKLVFGFEGLTLADGSIKLDEGSNSLKATLQCNGAPGAIDRIKGLLRSAPPGTTGYISGDYPSVLALQGAEAVLRQMVDDHVGADARRVSVARVLAARRTWNGEVLSAKGHTGGFWKLLGVSSRQTFSKFADAAYEGSTQCMEGAQKWLGRLEEVGVSAVLIQEDEDSAAKHPSLRAEQFNRSPIPSGLTSGPPLKTSKHLTFEEQSKCIGVRVLQLLVLGTCDAQKDPAKQAKQELEGRQLPFSVLRRWGGCLCEFELVALRELALCGVEL